MIYRDHVFVDIDDDVDYGLAFLKKQPMEQLLGQVGEFDNYHFTSVIDELKTNLFGETPKLKDVLVERIEQKLAQKILVEMVRNNNNNLLEND